MPIFLNILQTIKFYNQLSLKIFKHSMVACFIERRPNNIFKRNFMIILNYLYIMQIGNIYILIEPQEIEIVF